VGEKVTCSVLQVRKMPNESPDTDGEDTTLVYLNLISRSRAHVNRDRLRPMVHWKGKSALRTERLYPMVITDIEATYCTVAISPYISGQLYFIDVSKQKSIIKKFASRCYIGMRIVATVLSIQEMVGKSKHIILNRSRVESIVAGSSSVVLGQGSKVRVEDDVYPVVGTKMIGVVDFKCSFTPRPPAVMICLGGGRYGRVCITELSDPEDWTDLSDSWIDRQETEGEKKPSQHKALRKDVVLPGGLVHGSVVKCRVLSCEKNNIEVSTRPSRLRKGITSIMSIEPDALPVEGTVVKAYVAHTSSTGSFLRVSHELTANVYVKDLADEYVDRPSDRFPMGMLVEARVLTVSQTANDTHARLSLKPSVVSGDGESSSLSIGNIVEGTVKRVDQIGVFVKIHNSSLVGLSRKAMAVNHWVKDLNELFEVGDVVRAKVLSVCGHKISLGLKPSFFRETEEDEDDESEEGEGEKDEGEEEERLEGDVEEEEEEGSRDEEDNDREEEEEDMLVAVGEEDEDDEEMEEMIRNAQITADDSEEEEEKEKEQAKQSKKGNHPTVKQTQKRIEEDESESESESEAPTSSSSLFSKSSLRMSQPPNQTVFQWEDFTPAVTSGLMDEQGDEEEDEEEEKEEDATIGKSKRNRQKTSENKKQEEDIRRREIGLADGSLSPESAEDYERLLLAQPSSSLLWIRYMTLHLQGADVDAARAVAERALKTISFREDEEKYNIWQAYLNLEYKYGTMTSLESVFKRAVNESKGKYLHLNLADVYETAGNSTGAELLYEKCLKKYKKSKKVWMAYQHFRLRNKDYTGAKTLLSRSLQSLSRHKHIEVITKYAMAEFDYGSSDRGRDVFEELVKSYPKRTDLWHVYVDKETKSGNIAHARKLYERMTTLKASTKNIQTIFKKHLKFEMKYGNEETQTLVKKRAEEYVTSLL